VSDQGSISANQLLAFAAGDLWFPLFYSGKLLRIAVSG
jgi:hypothetical protein